MATYAIGDVQGCYKQLRELLQKIQFHPEHDTLWFTGDLVNRGPQSLETLRFIKELGDRHRVVLGNHDLHLLAVAYGAHPGWEEDTFQDILAAPDKEILLDWLIQQPLLHHDDALGFTLVHAGLAASWDLRTAQALALEVSTILKGSNALEFFKNMYGDQPNTWRSDLTGWDRYRCITNFFTRSRFCYPDGRLELQKKGKVQDTDELIPWFQLPQRANQDLKILFGHWAALGGVTNTPHVYALDTGCVWGYALTAMRLEDEIRVSIGSYENKK